MLLLIILSLAFIGNKCRHPAQLYEAFVIYLFSLSYFSCIGKQKQGKNQDYCLDFSSVIILSTDRC
jgi:prolipoprotein diacylglyceryltransferase